MLREWCGDGQVKSGLCVQIYISVEAPYENAPDRIGCHCIVFEVEVVAGRVCTPLLPRVRGMPAQIVSIIRIPSAHQCPEHHMCLTQKPRAGFVSMAKL